MGLLLRPGTYYARTPDGAYVLTQDGESSFTGRSVYELIDRLAPFLDGRHSLGDLTAGLPAERQTMVRDLITALLERSIVLDTGPEEAPGDSPAAVLARYRETATVVIGAGRLCRAVAAAAVRSGLRHVRVVPEPDGTLPHGTGLVLHADDRPMLERARRLDRVCRTANVPLAQALILGDHAWITTAAGGHGDPGWTSGVRRLLALRPSARDGLAAQGAPAALSDLTARVVAGQFVHGVFRSLTGAAGAAGAAGPARHWITSVGLATLHSEIHSFVPHPFEDPPPAPAGETDLVKRIALLRDGARFDDERFSRLAFRCAGEQAGVFTLPAERDFTQVPLHVCAAEVSDPAGLLGPGPVPLVIGAALDFATARYRAALMAFATYGSLMIDPRRVRTAGGHPAGWHEDPADALSGLRAGRLTGFVEGYGLADGGVHPVDVTHVFPALRAPSVPYSPPSGTAAAYDWDEAVLAGLLGQCLRLTMNDAMVSPVPFSPVDLASAVLGARGDHYRALAAGLSEPVTVYDITGPLGVPTMVCYLGPVPVSCASSLSPAGAVTDALERLVLHQQSRESGQPDYAPPPVRDVPARLRGDTARLLPGGGLPGDAVAGALARRGCRPVAIPLDHDPAVSALMPYAVRVVTIGE